jgi:twitching motility two-component system response regulator PilG
MAEEKEVIIAIDDDELTLATIEKVLGTAGDYEILTFNRSIRGQAEVKREAKQRKGLPLVLLDLNMPLLDGYTLFRNLRTNPELEKIPVIIISGYELDKSKIQGVREPDDYFSKPIDFLRLITAIKRVISQSRADTQGVIKANAEYVRIIESIIRSSRKKFD